MELKEYRLSLDISAKEASSSCGVPLRTYLRYEADDSYGSDLKREQIFSILKEKYSITESTGILKLETLKSIVNSILLKYKNDVSYCYLFGSYAKGYAKKDSDVDLCVSTSLKGFAFLGLVEELRQSLNKKVEVIRSNDLCNNVELINEIMKSGIKIYG